MLANKLKGMNVAPDFILWILDYLTDRKQFVHICPFKSNIINSNTGAPQGTVLAPFLFTLYTSDARSTDDNCFLIKFADDTMLLSLVKDNNDISFLRQIDGFVQYCKRTFLELNVNKTKEMVINFRKHDDAIRPVILDEQAVERVSNYKYLGVVFDNNLNWHDHIDMVLKKLQPRLYCLRMLHKFNVNESILSLFYNSIICSVWQYN